MATTTGAKNRCDKGHLLRDDVCSFCTQTGRHIYLSHEFYDSPFEDRIAPEYLFHVEYPVGAQNGTYFKTSKQKDGMTVWLWGGRHPDDVKARRF